MYKFVELFERYIMFFILILMMITIVLSTVELLFIIIQEIEKPPFMLLNIDKMLEIFGFFMMIMIGLELITSVKMYLKNESIQAEIVLMVALIAIARKIIILDSKSIDGITMLGLGVLVIALSAGFFLIRKGCMLNVCNKDKKLNE